MTTPEEDEVIKYFANVKPCKEDKGAFCMGVTFLLLALCVPAYQAILRLQSGYWTPLPISDGIHFVGWHIPKNRLGGRSKDYRLAA
jgi:hypothetical protein